MRTMQKLLLSFVVVTLLLPAVQGADFTPRIPKRPLELDPPAMPWGKPADGPPIRALFVVPWAASRDAYALAQHLPIEFDIVETRDSNRIHFDDDTMGRSDHPEFARTMERLDKFLDKKYDVIVFGAVNLGSLPANLQYKALKQAVEGGGLVLANQDWKTLGKLRDPLLKDPVGEEAWNAAVPWSVFRMVRLETVNPYPGVRFRATKSSVAQQFESADAFGKIVRRYRLKQGRLALLDYGRQHTSRRGTCLSPAGLYPLDRIIQHEYYISAAAKQIRWAAGRNPKARIVSIQPNATSPDRSELSTASQVVLTCDGKPPAGCSLRCVVRDIDGDVEWKGEKEVHLAGQKTEVPVGVPSLKTGEHFLDVWLLRAGKVLDWGSGHFTVTSDVGIEETALDKDVLKRGDPVSGTIKLKGEVAEGACRLRVVDSYGRLEVVQSLPVKAGQKECRFSVTLPDPVGIVFRLEAWLEVGDKAVAEGRAEFTIPKRFAADRFYGILWGGAYGPGPIAGIVYREARRYGYDASLAAFPFEYAVREAALADLATVPYMIRLMSCDGKKHCFTSDQWRKEMSEGLEAHARVVGKYGALGYSLGDETRLETRIYCESPTCLKAFHDYLRKRYGTLDALNKKWRSDFKAWDEIKPSWVEEVRKKEKNFVPWMDYQSHRRDLWVRACKWCADAIHRGDPGARMGYEGAPGNERWPELLEFFRITGPYNWPDNDIVIDERRPGCITGNWIGSYGAHVENSWIRYMSWWRLLQDFNSQWWWTQQFGFNGDGTPVRRFAANVDAFAELNSGLRKLLSTGTFVHDPVAIPYCPASDLATDIYSEQTSIQGAKDTARAILHDLSLHHWRVPTKKIAKGELERRGVRVLFLPYHQAMTKDAAAGIRRFVEQGGTLIADLRPAVMDEHGDALKEGYLDAVFGIRRKGPAQSEGVRGTPKGEGPVAAVQQSNIELTADAAVEVTTGKAWGTVADAPICIENKIGKGRAILLNFALGDYLVTRQTEKHRALQTLFADLLKEAEVAPSVRVTAGGKPLDGLWLARWQVGTMLVSGIDRHPVSPARDNPVAAKVRWPQTGELYDVRAGKYLGRKNEIEIKLAVHEPKLIAWLSYRIGKLSVTGPAAARPGDRPEATVKLADVSAPHMVCFDVFGPDGKRRVYFRRRLLLKDGAGKTAFPLALNAPPGAWRIRAQEVISGQTVWHELKVESP